jgi:hypothetical protein
VGPRFGQKVFEKIKISSRYRDFFLVLFVLLIHFVPLNPSLLLHFTYVPYYCPDTTNTTQISMPPVAFEPTIAASERPQTHALDRAASGIGKDSNSGP